MVARVGWGLLTAGLLTAGAGAQMQRFTATHRDVVYASPDGIDQQLDVYLPAGDGPFPTLIWVHGGGWQNGDKTSARPALEFLDEGYAVASLDYRLSGVATFPAQIQDCKAGLRFLRAHAAEYRLDPTRFCAMGSSAGGHLVALLGTSGGEASFEVGDNLEQSSSVQAVVDYYGPTDLVAFVQTPGYEGHARPGSPESKLLGFPPQDRPEESAKANSITYVDPKDPPFLIFHGTQDPTVPPDQSRLLHEALDLAGVANTLRFLDGAKHGGPEFFAPEVVEEVRQFLSRHLRGDQNVAADSDEAPASRAAASPANLSPLRIDGERWLLPTPEGPVRGILVKPQGPGPFGGIVLSHGRGGDALRFALAKARVMAGWGLVAIGCDLTHAGGSDSDPSTYGDSEENLRRARLCLDLLASLPEIDPRRLAAYGNSMGAFVTIGLAAAEPERITAAVITAGGIGPRDPFPAPTVAVAEAIRSPFLILHGAADRTVAPAASAKLETVLQERHVPCRRVVYEGVGHELMQARSDEVMAEIRAWLLTHHVLAE